MNRQALDAAASIERHAEDGQAILLAIDLAVGVTARIHGGWVPLASHPLADALEIVEILETACVQKGFVPLVFHIEQCVVRNEPPAECLQIAHGTASVHRGHQDPVRAGQVIHPGRPRALRSLGTRTLHDFLGGLVRGTGFVIGFRQRCRLLLG